MYARNQSALFHCHCKHIATIKKENYIPLDFEFKRKKRDNSFPYVFVGSLRQRWNVATV